MGKKKKKERDKAYLYLQLNLMSLIQSYFQIGSIVSSKRYKLKYGRSTQSRAQPNFCIFTEEAIYKMKKASPSRSVWGWMFPASCTSHSLTFSKVTDWRNTSSPKTDPRSTLTGVAVGDSKTEFTRRQRETTTCTLGSWSWKPTACVGASVSACVAVVESINHEALYNTDQLVLGHSCWWVAILVEENQPGSKYTWGNLTL